MAKKSVASLQTGSKRLTKAIKMVRSPKSGAYSFVETILPPDRVNDFLRRENPKIFLIKSLVLDKK